MKPEVGRRVFVGSVVAGLPLLATAGPRPFAQSPSEGMARAQSLDPITNELQRQLKLLVPQIRQGRHAAARQVAGLLRISSVQAAHVLDAELKVHLRRAVNRYGKNGFLINHGHAHERLKKELADYGLSPDQLPSTTYATKERVLDALLASGLSVYLTNVAVVMDAVATEMEARGPLIPVVLRQTPDPTNPKCKEFLDHLQAAEAAVAAACGAATLFPNPVTAAACAFAVGALSGMLTAYFINCFFIG